MVKVVNNVVQDCLVGELCIGDCFLYNNKVYRGYRIATPFDIEAMCLSHFEGIALIPHDVKVTPVDVILTVNPKGANK